MRKTRQILWNQFLIQIWHRAVRVSPAGVRHYPPWPREPLAGSHGLLQRLSLEGEGLHEAVPGESASGDREESGQGAVRVRATSAH